MNHLQQEGKSEKLGVWEWRDSISGMNTMRSAQRKWCKRAVWVYTWASYQIRKIAGCTCAGNAGDVFTRGRLQRKPLVSDPGMHQGTCVTHVPWCMSGSLTRVGGENVPGIPGACATRKFTYLARSPLQYSSLVWSRGLFYYLFKICTKNQQNLILVNSLALEKFTWNFRLSTFQYNFNDWWLSYRLWNCPQMGATEPYWWYVSIVSLVLPGNNPLPEPMLTQINVAIWFD